MILATTLGEAIGEAIAEVFGTTMLFALLIGIAGITILVIVICLVILAIVKHHRKKNGYEKENKKGIWIKKSKLFVQNNNFKFPKKYKNVI